MEKQELEIYLQQVIQEAKALNLPVSKRIDPLIRLNRRAKSRFASCRTETNRPGAVYTIEVGEALLRSTGTTVKGILAHEVLHTCPGCRDHGSKWKAYAEKMNEAYGYTIKRTSTYEELGLEAPQKNREANYLLICRKCGRQIERQKKSRLVTHTGEYRCTCGGKLDCYKKG